MTRWLRARLAAAAPAGSLRRRLAAGTLWSAASAASIQISTVVAAVLVARILGVADFGALSIVNATMGLLGIFAGLGFGLTATKYIAELRVTMPGRAAAILDMLHRAVLVSGVVVAAFLVAAAPWLATEVLAAPALVDELRVASLLLLFNEINGLQIGALAGFEAFRTIARINLVRGLVTVPFAVIGAAAFGVMGGVLALIATAFIALLLSARALRVERERAGLARPAGVTFRSEMPVLWRYALPAFLGSVVVGPVTWIGNAWLASGPNGYSELGVFSAANQWRTAVLFMPQVIGQAALPMLAALLGAGLVSSARRVLGGTMLATAAGALPIAIILILGRDAVMDLYGPGFGGHGAVLVIVAMTVVILAVQLPVGQVIAASGRMWLGFWLNLAWAAVFLVAAAQLLQRGLGALGLALAFLIAYAAHTIWTSAAAIALMRAAATGMTAPLDGPVSTGLAGSISASTPDGVDPAPR